MGQHASVTDRQFVILIPLDLKFKTLTVFHFECYMVRVAVMMVTVAVMVMRLSSHIYDHSRHRKNRGILILDKLTDILRNDEEKQDEPNNYKYFHFYLPKRAQRTSHTREVQL